MRLLVLHLLKSYIVGSVKHKGDSIVVWRCFRGSADLIKIGANMITNLRFNSKKIDRVAQELFSLCAKEEVFPHYDLACIINKSYSD